jgi:hypothetical protein
MDGLHGFSQLRSYKQFRISRILKLPCPGHSRMHMRLSNFAIPQCAHPHTHSAQSSSAWASTVFNASSCKSGEYQILMPLVVCEE